MKNRENESGFSPEEEITDKGNQRAERAVENETRYKEGVKTLHTKYDKYDKEVRELIERGSLEEIEKYMNNSAQWMAQLEGALRREGRYYDQETIKQENGDTITVTCGIALSSEGNAYEIYFKGIDIYNAEAQKYDISEPMIRVPMEMAKKVFQYACEQAKKGLNVYQVYKAVEKERYLIDE